MADLKKDWIDFGKLEQELNKAVEKDAKYWRENDAKFRAVEQRVETYEQFRDIVKAAHIKPLEKKDKIGEGKRNQPWNPYTFKTTSPTSSSADDFIHQKPKSLPQTSHEFTREWKSGCHTASDRYNILMSLGAEKLGQIFRAEIGFGLLGNFIGVLNEHFQTEDLKYILDILESLAKTNRFSLSVGFLCKDEQEKCVQLFQKLQSLELFDVTSAKTEEGTHQHSQLEKEDRTERLNALRKLYGL